MLASDPITLAHGDKMPVRAFDATCQFWAKSEYIWPVQLSEVVINAAIAKVLKSPWRTTNNIEQTSNKRHELLMLVERGPYIIDIDR
jgi:hypothetical protein